MAAKIERKIRTAKRFGDIFVNYPAYLTVDLCKISGISEMFSFFAYI